MEDDIPFIDRLIISEASEKINLIIGADFSLDDLLLILVSTDPGEKNKSRAIELFYKCMDDRPDALFLLLGRIFRHTTRRDIKWLISNALLQRLRTSKGRILKSMMPTTVSYLKAVFLVSFQKDESNWRMYGDLVVQFAIFMLPEGKWDELYRFMSDNMDSPTIRQRLAHVIDSLCKTDPSVLLYNLNLYHTYFHKSICSSDMVPADRIRLVMTFLSFLRKVSLDEYPNSKDLIPVILNAMKACNDADIFPCEIESSLRTMLSLGSDFLGPKFTEVHEMHKKQLILSSRDAYSNGLLSSKSLTSFEELIMDLNCSKSKNRDQARTAFRRLKKNRTWEFIERLLLVLEFSDNNVVREITTDVLHEHLDVIIPRYSYPDKIQLQFSLWVIFKNEKEFNVQKQIGYVFSKLALNFDWHLDAHINFVLECLSSDVHNLQLSAFLLLKEIIQDDFEAISPYTTQLHAILCQRMSSPSHMTVRLASLCTTFNILPHLINSLKDFELKELEKNLIQTLKEGLLAWEVSDLDKVFISLNELAELDPKALTSKFVGLVLAVLDVSEMEGVETETISLGIEFLVTLLESGVAKDVSLKIGSRLLLLIMKQMVSLLVSNGDLDLYQDYKKSVRRVATSMRDADLIQIAATNFQSYFSASQWERKVVGLATIVKVARGCSLDNMEQFIMMVMSLYFDNDKNVLVAASHATLNLCMVKKIRLRYGDRMIKALEDAINGFKCTEAQDSARSILLKCKQLWD